MILPGMKNVSCPICGKYFQSKNYHYERHIRKHDDKMIQCNFCIRKFKTKIYLAKHESKLHGVTTNYNCQYCDYTTIDSPSLEIHIDRKHNTNFQYFCDKCDKKFRQKSEFTRHMISHETTLCECFECGATLPNKLILIHHLNRFHREKKFFDCPFCTKKLKSQKNLEMHLQVHNQKFICEICGMEFPRKQALKRHIISHTDRKSFLCETCGKVFSNLTSQQVHTLKHIGKRPYICDICGKSFTQRTPMMVHRKKHPGNHPPPPPVKIATIFHNMDDKMIVKKRGKREKLSEC